MNDTDKLRDKLTEADRAYHGSGRPIMTDAEYDDASRQLSMEEALAAAPVPADSPTQTVGTDPDPAFGRIAHDPPMLSLRKFDSADDMADWFARLPASAQRLNVTVKYDGIAAALRYSQGRLTLAATRGNGREGEDITGAVRLVPGVPKAIDHPGDLEVRGEIVAVNRDFERICEDMESADEEPYSSPRNFTSGTLRASEPDPERCGALTFLPYWQSGLEMPTAMDIYPALTALGFMPPWTSDLATSPRDIVRIAKGAESARERMPYDADGIVARVNDDDAFERLGHRSNTPNGAAALKFAASTARTVLTDVAWQVGRTGVVTPRAVLVPVRVGDVVVSSATLHNTEQIRRLDLHVGDTVLVERAGEVIPAIKLTIPELRPHDAAPVRPPSNCPACGSELSMTGPQLYCDSEHCPEQAARRIEHFAGRDYMRIEHLGPETIADLSEAGLVSDPADLYDLKDRAAEISALPGMGERKVARLMESVERSKSQPLSRVLAALGIREVGQTASRAIAKEAGDMQTAMNMTRERLEAIEDMGPIMTSYFLSYMNDPRSLALISRLAEAGVNMTEPKDQSEPKEGGLAGLNIVVTGRLQRFTRTEIESFIKMHGGRPSRSVSRRTNYLVVGEKPGSKRTKALGLGVPVISEHQLVKLASK